MERPYFSVVDIGVGLRIGLTQPVLVGYEPRQKTGLNRSFVTTSVT